MHSKGIIQSGLSGKKLRKRVSTRAFTRRTSPGVTGPPLITSTRSGRHATHARSSRRRLETCALSLAATLEPWGAGAGEREEDQPAHERSVSRGDGRSGARPGRSGEG